MAYDVHTYASCGLTDGVCHASVLGSNNILLLVGCLIYVSLAPILLFALSKMAVLVRLFIVCFFCVAFLSL